MENPNNARSRVWSCTGLGILLVVLLTWPLVFSNPFYVTLGTMLVLATIGATSLNLIIRTGHISLAHAAFMGVAAYTCVVLEMRMGWPFWFAITAGCCASGLLALMLGPVVLRLTGKYFVLVTFLVGEIIRMVFVEWQGITGGANGIQQIPLSLDLFGSSLQFYYFALLVSAICVGIVWRILTSDLGRVIDSVREADRVAECSGVPVIRIKVMVFVIACMLVGIQGGLQAHLVRAIDPSAYNMDASLNMVVMNVLGGMYYLAGPLVGTGFMVALPEMLRGYVELQQVIFGIILIIVMAVLPGGMIGAFALGRALLRRFLHREKA
ncbi:branched-chain amino acid ABC transporter permease [Caenimonas aquaedulcis]|uniref:Branched-chain amino acid ABC transporter permease n=1 Tax=Caenimonas aquaedulcis TaxID=2793270 RepID=A0A931H1F0_9BURK|nr:branched-chain amino acid ABC transporter permease [Caenimonas aquaedulcis]MBG9386773.1 branched-chain amino acid ABC transporter permease [Caenimonas aquaedulcis]